MNAKMKQLGNDPDLKITYDQGEHNSNSIGKPILGSNFEELRHAKNNLPLGDIIREKVR